MEVILMKDNKTLSRRRYEHVNAMNVTPEFIQKMRRDLEKPEIISDDIIKLFDSAIIENTEATSKRKCTVRISVARNNGNIFINHAKKPIVEAYYHPTTDLLVTQSITKMNLDYDGTRDVQEYTPHHQFQMLALAFVEKVVKDYIDEVTSLSPNELQAIGIKPLNQIIMELKEYIEEGTKIYKNVAEELQYLVTPEIPPVNQFMVFADESASKYTVTERVQYPNPINYLDMDTRTVDRFLDAFFDETDKARFSWYMGAALRNIRVDDPAVSKMLMMTSARAGSGKSTLVTAMTNALFGRTYGNINGDFDEHFSMDNKFVSSGLTDTRMNVYLEAEFGEPTKDGNLHNFNRMRVSAIKTMITDGYMATEEKYQSRKNQRAFGLHMVLTNHPARITEETDALRRRILPCLVKPTSMETKAKQLGLFGQKTFEEWVLNHALEFAVYFVRHHIEHEYDYSEYLYNSNALIRELNHYKTAGNKNLDPIALMERNSDNIFAVLDIASQHYNFELEKFITDIENTKPGISYDDIRISNGTLYINASEKFWSRYSTQPATIRDIMIEVYGAPEKKFSKNRFTTPLSHTDLSDFRETQEAIKAHAEKETDEVVDYTVATPQGDVSFAPISSELQEKLTKHARKVKEHHIKTRVEKPVVKEPEWMKHVDKSTLIGYQEQIHKPKPTIHDVNDSDIEQILTKLDSGDLSVDDAKNLVRQMATTTQKLYTLIRGKLG